MKLKLGELWIDQYSYSVTPCKTCLLNNEKTKSGVIFHYWQCTWFYDGFSF